METTIVYWGYIGIMENKMETAIDHGGYIRVLWCFFSMLMIWVWVVQRV